MVVNGLVDVSPAPLKVTGVKAAGRTVTVTGGAVVVTGGRVTVTGGEVTVDAGAVIVVAGIVIVVGATVMVLVGIEKACIAGDVVIVVVDGGKVMVEVTAVWLPALSSVQLDNSERRMIRRMNSDINFFIIFTTNYSVRKI